MAVANSVAGGASRSEWSVGVVRPDGALEFVQHNLFARRQCARGAYREGAASAAFAKRSPVAHQSVRVFSFGASCAASGSGRGFLGDNSGGYWIRYVLLRLNRSNSAAFQSSRL